ncbi:MAG: hypothetical protein H6581_13930 [Bacteroidia bacterium]|nr:hypothetical protein [Bacteroidia bacterium]
MKPVFTLALSLLLFFSLACGKKSRHRHEVEQEQKVAESPNGRVQPNLGCEGFPEEKYALYLPKDWSAEKKWPVIVWFDPGAEGFKPVKKYQALAEEFGFIMVGSNHSKNGMNWGEIQSLNAILTAEILKKYAVAPGKIYLGGFSGGARVANLLALNDTTSKAVIGCGAGFPQGQSLSHMWHSFFGLVGDEDFNLPELQALNEGLNNEQTAHYIRVFAGEHAWPPVEDMRMAFHWLKLEPLRHARVPDPKDARVKNYLSFLEERRKEGPLDTWKMYKFWEEEAAFLRKITSIETPTQNMLKASMDGGVKARLKQERDLRIKEQSLMNHYQQIYPQKDLVFWRAEIAKFWKSVENEPAPGEGKMYQRILNLLSLTSYMYAKQTLGANDIPSSDRFLEIYRLVDPDNPEAYYLTAKLRLRQGRVDEAVAQLQKAVEYKFAEPDRFKADPDFETLQGLPVYGEIWARFQDNKNQE